MGVDISGKNILVTGANRGIGKQILETMLEQRASKVYAAVRKVDSVKELVDKYGDKVVPVELDLSKPETITAAASTASDVHIVVNNGGVLTNTEALDEKAIESLQFEFDVNVYGLIRMAQAFAPVLKQNGGGALVQLNSVASVKAFAPFATYSASKAASYSITQSLRDSLKEQGTHVLSVHPGPIDTDMGTNAGLQDMAEPPTLVSEGIVTALKAGDFHLFPDTMAKQVGGEYESFAKNIVEADLMES